MTSHRSKSLFVLILAFIYLAHPWAIPKASAFEGHSLVIQEPYLPQKFDLGGAIGISWSTSAYFLGEAFAGVQLTPCAFHCFQYLDASVRIAAQNGQTNYMGSVGWRFQKYFDDSSWGPYLRPFLGINHYIYSAQASDTGFGGLAVGSYYFLHPGADARFEIGQSIGPTPWTFVTIGFVFKFRNI